MNRFEKLSAANKRGWITRRRNKRLDKSDSPLYNSVDRGNSVDTTSKVIEVLRKAGLINERKLRQFIDKQAVRNTPPPQAVVSKGDKKKIESYLNNYGHCALYTCRGDDGKAVVYFVSKKVLKPWPFKRRGYGLNNGSKSDNQNGGINGGSGEGEGNNSSLERAKEFALG